jgi:hypothetical protein
MQAPLLAITVAQVGLTETFEKPQDLGIGGNVARAAAPTGPWAAGPVVPATLDGQQTQGRATVLQPGFLNHAHSVIGRIDDAL